MELMSLQLHNRFLLEETSPSEDITFIHAVPLCLGSFRGTLSVYTLQSIQSSTQRSNSLNGLCEEGRATSHRRLSVIS